MVRHTAFIRRGLGPEGVWSTYTKPSFSRVLYSGYFANVEIDRSYTLLLLSCALVVAMGPTAERAREETETN